MEKILVVEDEKDMLLGLKDNLEYEGYEVLTARNGEEGVEAAVTRQPDLILLDIMMPKMDGYDVCRELRRRGIDIPIIMLTAKSQEIDKVIGLELGADDYITKPFSIREMIARVKAVLRRRGTHQQKLEAYEFGRVKVDFRKSVAVKGDRTVELSHYENEILRLLIANKEEPVSRSRLLDEVWGYDLFPTTRTIDNHIVKLRQKIEDDPRTPEHIVTVHGVGYKFVE